MQLIGQGDIVARALFVFLAIMLFASVYLALIKAISLSWRLYRAKRFLGSLAKARSLRQMQECVDGWTTNESFSRLTHRIMAEQKKRNVSAASRDERGDALGAAAQRLIAVEAAEQAADLHQGLVVLAAMAWMAPVTGLAATAWYAGGVWLQSALALGAAGEPWIHGLALLQLGLVVAVIALPAYLCLRAANRMYLSRFARFGRMIQPMLEQGGEVPMRGVKPGSGFTRVWRSALDANA